MFVKVDTPDRPTVSLDIANVHGRRALSIRVDGMVISSLLLDVEYMDTMEDKSWKRFCPFCGEEINLVSSKTHVCKEEKVAGVVGTYWES